MRRTDLKKEFFAGSVGAVDERSSTALSLSNGAD
jgi:hypothetical protein